jgi:hypothetical protein
MIQKYWYVIVIVFLGFLALSFLLKWQQEKRKTHDEVKRHHKELSQEEKFNKTWYTWLYVGDRLAGKIKATKLKGHIVFDKKRDPLGKEVKTPKAEKEFLYLSVDTSKLGITKSFALWFTEKHLVIPYELVKYHNEKKAIVIPQDVDLELYKGYFLPTIFENEQARKFIDSEFSKLEMDYEINAHANQLIKFSSVHHDYGHDIRKLEKEAEVERAKKERKRVG